MSDWLNLGNLDDAKTTEKKVEKKLEFDATFRTRILYVGGDGSAAVRRIEMATGVDLDSIAMEFELSRRFV